LEIFKYEADLIKIVRGKEKAFQDGGMPTLRISILLNLSAVVGRLKAGGVICIKVELNDSNNKLWW